MRRWAWIIAAVVVSAGGLSADWGDAPTASGIPVGTALGPGYGPPPGFSYPSMPVPPSEGPHPTLWSYMAAPSERPPARYGFNPSIKHAFHSIFTFWKKHDDGSYSCDTPHKCRVGHGWGHGSGNIYDGQKGLNYGPAPLQGTLVFPHHPFVRGPRDYFMWEPR